MIEKIVERMVDGIVGPARTLPWSVANLWTETMGRQWRSKRP
jgi:hypothetical protein